MPIQKDLIHLGDLIDSACFNANSFTRRFCVPGPKLFDPFSNLNKNKTANVNSKKKKTINFLDGLFSEFSTGF